MLVLDKNSGHPLYMQIYYYYREQIATGIIEGGTILPPIRSLANDLQVSRNTVESAYQQLSSEGYVSSKMCSGFKVREIESDLYHKYITVSRGAGKAPLEMPHEQGVVKERKYNFQYGRLSITDFPLHTWRKLVNQALTSENVDCMAAYNDRKGLQDLRLEIMRYLFDSRGVVCRPDQIILCSGTLSCLNLVSELLMNEIKTVAVEEPSYDSARTVFINHGLGIIPLRLQEDGIDMDALEETSARLLYLTPSHQFPYGCVTKINKRLNLLEWADNNDAYIIEDDYDSELRYNSRPIPSMQSLDKKGRVIYLNTFSKAFAPGLRTSFIVLPQTLLERYHSVMNKYNCGVPWLEQAVLCEFMRQGYWNRHLRKVCLSNKKKHDILVETINGLMGEKVKIYGKNGGLHILLEVKNGLCEKELIEKASHAGVTVYPVSNYFSNPMNYSDNMVLIGYSGLSEEDIIDGIKLLNSAWFL